MNKVLQFEVWNECNNNCIFCSNKYVYDNTTQEKLNNLNIILNKLKDPSTFEKYNKIGFIGGEFFQGQLKDFAVRSLFFDILIYLKEKLDNKTLDEVWFTATMIDENQDDLYNAVNIFSDKSKIWICTSYDTKGRFHTEKQCKQWKHNVETLKLQFPTININVTTILTGSFIDEYLNGKFNIIDFTTKYKCTWFNKPPMLPSECKLSKKEYNDTILENFFPTRKKFLDFLMKFKYRESELEYDKLFNTELRADALIKTDYHNYNNRMVIERNKETSEEITIEINNDNYLKNQSENQIVHNETSEYCKHNKAYTPYVDSDKCFYCDKEFIKQL